MGMGKTANRRAYLFQDADTFHPQEEWFVLPVLAKINVRRRE
jgi:hypothetical protein